MIPITKELMDDIVISKADLFKRLVVVECDIKQSKDYHKGGSYTIQANDVIHRNAILKSKYKLRNGTTRLKFIVDESRVSFYSVA